MCEWLAFLMLFFSCDMCGVDCRVDLYLTPAGDGNYYVSLSNECPVRGVQFTITPPDGVSYRTTRRTAEFFAQAHETNGVVVLFSLSGDMIAPGNGPILELIIDRPYGSSYMSAIKIFY